MSNNVRKSDFLTFQQSNWLNGERLDRINFNFTSILDGSHYFPIIKLKCSHTCPLQTALLMDMVGSDHLAIALYTSGSCLFWPAEKATWFAFLRIGPIF